MKICLWCGRTAKKKEDYCICGRPVHEEKPVESPIPEPNLPDPQGKGNLV